MFQDSYQEQIRSEWCSTPAPAESPSSLSQIIADLNLELAKYPNNPITYNKRGIAYFTLKDYQRAIGDYNRAIELDANFAAAYFNRGWAFAGQGYYQWAAADFKHARVLNPEMMLYDELRHILPETALASLPSRKVYHQRYWLLYAIFIATFLLILPAITVILALAEPTKFYGSLAASLTLLSLLMAGLTGILVFSMWNVRLIIAPEGIMYSGTGFRVYSPWWNVKGIGSQQMGSRQVSGLLVGLSIPTRLSLEESIRQQMPALEESGWLRFELKLRPLLRLLALLGGLTPRYVDKALDMRTYTSIIPISLFVSHWQHSEAAVMIAQYIPHVFG